MTYAAIDDSRLFSADEGEGGETVLLMYGGTYGSGDRLLEAEADKMLRHAVEGHLGCRGCPLPAVSAASSLKAKGTDADPVRSASARPHSVPVAWGGVGHRLIQERPAEFSSLVLDRTVALPTPVTRS